jgi:DNA polymerase-4
VPRLPEPVRLLPGVGAPLARKLETLGITLRGQSQALSERDAARNLGDDGPALVRRARGEDARAVDRSREAKSISAEMTFDRDLSAVADLERHLWRLCEKLAHRLKANELAAGGVVPKLKTPRFALRTRAARLSGPTVLPDRLFDLARSLLMKEVTGTAFRLIGIGAAPLVPGSAADRGDLADSSTPGRAAAQAAIDALQPLRRGRDHARAIAALSNRSACRIGLTETTGCSAFVARFADSRSREPNSQPAENGLVRVLINKNPFISPIRNRNCND